MEKTRREYNKWVATETIEDYALRYAPSSYRKWPELLICNTALGSISFLALEAIGAVIAIDYGFSNALWAIAFASVIIFLTGLPISYYTARYNIDIDLLTRSAGFGYVGSTITSLIYASFCFIFFALEAAIMAQALKLYFQLPLYIGYLFCSIIIIPLVYYGITLINRLQFWTQPIWIFLMVWPFVMLIIKQPDLITNFSEFSGQLSQSHEFNPYYFGIATGISLSLIAQIGEQVDYLRFMPDKHAGNRWRWWFSVILAGPGWIILGFAKQLGGAFLAFLVIVNGLAISEAKEPVEMYYIAYRYVFDNPETALAVSTLFVIISQIKINVTNAYAGSLAWSNFFSRVTQTHPGRVVWMVFNIAIALLLMELGVFNALEKILGLYSNVAIAWIGAIVADLVINKPLKLSPPMVEFKRGHLYDFNPVGFFSMLLASFIAIVAFSGAMGEYAQAYSALIALMLSLILSPLIAIITKGKYYLARPEQQLHIHSEDTGNCTVCELQYDRPEFAFCPYYDAPICSLCCTLETDCHDCCKPEKKQIIRHVIIDFLALAFKNSISQDTRSRIANFVILSSILLTTMGTTLWLILTVTSDQTPKQLLPYFQSNYTQLFLVFAVLICIGAWWIVLLQESRELAESGFQERNDALQVEIAERKKIETELLKYQISLHEQVDERTKELNNAQKIVVRNERLATIGRVSGSIAHELRNPLASIRNAVYYLRRKIPDSELKWHEYMKIIDDEVQASNQIITNLLEMSRPVKLNVSTVSLNALLDEVFLAQSWNNASYRFDFSPDPFELKCDHSKMKQVFENLLSNALAGNESNTEIIVKATRDNQYVIITFQDNGPGIEGEHRQHIFEPLYSTKTKGIGLGLWICNEIVKHHNGSITLEDSDDKYTRFLIKIPHNQIS